MRNAYRDTLLLFFKRKFLRKIRHSFVSLSHEYAMPALDLSTNASDNKCHYIVFTSSRGTSGMSTLSRPLQHIIGNGLLNNSSIFARSSLAYGEKLLISSVYLSKLWNWRHFLHLSCVHHPSRHWTCLDINLRQHALLQRIYFCPGIRALFTCVKPKEWLATQHVRTFVDQCVPCYLLPAVKKNTLLQKIPSFNKRFTLLVRIQTGCAGTYNRVHLRAHRISGKPLCNSIYLVDWPQPSASVSFVYGAMESPRKSENSFIQVHASIRWLEPCDRDRCSLSTLGHHFAYLKSFDQSSNVS